MRCPCSIFVRLCVAGFVVATEIVASEGQALDASCVDDACAAAGSDQPSLLQQRTRGGVAARGRLAGSGSGVGAESCGDVRRRRRQASCGCRRRVSVSAVGDRNLACIGDEITTMPRDENGFVNLTVMLEWVYQEPIIANLMNLPAVACQERAHTFFNCQVLQPNQSMSLESSMPYKVYVVLGTDTPSNWENLRNVLSPISKIMGPVALVGAFFTGGVSAAAYVAMQQVVTKELTKGAMWGVGQLMGDSGALNETLFNASAAAEAAGLNRTLVNATAVAEAAENITRHIAEQTPEMLSAWSSKLGAGESYLKIVGGLGGDVEQASPEPAAMRIVEMSKEAFAELRVIDILPEP